MLESVTFGLNLKQWNIVIFGLNHLTIKVSFHAPWKNSGEHYSLCTVRSSVTPRIRFWAITLLFVVGLRYCLVQMIAITRWRVAHKRPFATIKVFTFVYIFHPLILILRGASIRSTVYIGITLSNCLSICLVSATNTIPIYNLRMCMKED